MSSQSEQRSPRLALHELAAGVDALYLSGRAGLAPDLVERLEAARVEAQGLSDSGNSPPFDFGGRSFRVMPGGLGRYRYWLTHCFGQLGISVSDRLPAIRIQPSAELLHGMGPAETVAWFREVVEREVGSVLLTVSRIDLHSDWQGWRLHGDDRHRFLCRADARTTYELGGQFTGFEFGRRATKTVCARIYDKTRDVEKKGADYWYDIWGEAFEPDVPVHRIEFEINRLGLREYGLDSPEDALASVGGLWADLTTNWLTFRTPTDDGTRSRWPVAPEWLQIARARLTNPAIGARRVRDGQAIGDLRRLAPTLVGSLTSYAALIGAEDWGSTSTRLASFIAAYGRTSGRSFEDRVRAKRLNGPLR